MLQGEQFKVTSTLSCYFLAMLVIAASRAGIPAPAAPGFLLSQAA